MGQGEARIEGDRAFEQLAGQPIVVGGVAANMFDAAQQAFIGRQTLRALARGTLDLRLLDPASEGGHDRAGDLVLDLEQLADVAIVAFGPDMIARRGIDQLRRDAQPLDRFADAALDHISDAELAAETLHVDILTAVLKGRVPGDYEELTEPRQLGDDVLGDAVYDIL